MAIDRQIWKYGFTLQEGVPWPCPACGRAKLRVEQCSKADKDSNAVDMAIFERPFPSWDDQLDKDWDSYVGAFAAVLRCGDTGCRAVVSVAGQSVQGDTWVGQGSYWVMYFVPQYFYPAIPVFSIPKGCPVNTRKEIEAAFSLYWADPGACVNRIRSAIELFLTYLGVKVFEIRVGKGRKSNRRIRLSLHERIQLLEKSQPELNQTLMAIKWLGNVGSHPGERSKDEALDGFELLEHVLNERFVQHKKYISRLSKTIIRKKGRSKS